MKPSLIPQLACAFTFFLAEEGHSLTHRPRGLLSHGGWVRQRRQPRETWVFKIPRSGHQDDCEETNVPDGGKQSDENRQSSSESLSDEDLDKNGDSQDKR